MRYHSASMRKYVHFHITVVKKNHHFGPIFWPIFDRFLTIFVKNFNPFLRARMRLRPNFDLFLTLFFLPTMRIQIVSSESHPLMRINPHTSASSASAWPSLVPNPNIEHIFLKNGYDRPPSPPFINFILKNRRFLFWKRGVVTDFNNKCCMHCLSVFNTPYKS